MADLSVDIRKCARCGGDHRGLQFSRFEGEQPEVYSRWAMCPEVNEPILMQVIEEKESADV